ncbi:hypothetical protein Tco_1269024 [Tanacetum coccineum]
MANQFPFLTSLAIESNSYEFPKQMKVCLSNEVGTEDDFAQDMDEYCSLVKQQIDNREGLMAELGKLAVSVGAARYLEILRRKQDRDVVKLRLLRELLRHARDETHQMP